MRPVRSAFRRGALAGMLVVAGMVVSACGQESLQVVTAPVVDSTWGQDAIVSATGKVLPRMRADLSFRMSGPVSAVMVSDGQAVTAGRVLAEMDLPELRSAVTQAEAALATAQTQLAQLEAPVPKEEVRRAQAAVDTAGAQARAREIEAAATCSQSETSQAAVEAAQAGLAQVLARATTNERELARLSVERAKAELYGLQGLRDAVGGLRRSSAYEVGSFEAAEGQVFAAEAGVQMAEVQQRIVAEGARDEDIDAAKAHIKQAEATLASAERQCEAAQQHIAVAQSQVKAAQAGLSLVQALPREADLDVARAGIVQAQAALDAALANLGHGQLRAPFAGTVAHSQLRVGEMAVAGLPVVSLGGLDELYIETTDLDEIDVARIREGSEAEVTFDALTGVTVRTQVESIGLKAGAGSGGTTFRVTIALSEPVPGLRWGMTAFVDIEAE